MGLPTLSEYQIKLLESMTQIYRHDTLVKLWGRQEADRLWKSTQQEIIFQLGKGSLAANSRLFTREFGYVRHDELLNAVDGNTVISTEGDQFASNAFLEGRGQMLKVTTRKGYEARVYEKHGFLGCDHSNMQYLKRGVNGTKLDWYNADEIEPGFIIPIKTGWGEVSEPLDVSTEEAWFVGAMIGDGSFPSDKESGAFTNSTPEVQNRWIDYVESIGCDYVVRESGWGCWRAHLRPGRDSVYKSIMRKHNCIYSPGEEKTWNYDWTRLTKKSLGALLNGLWATDGYMCVQYRGRETSCTVALDLTTESVVRGVHDALTQLGVVSKIYQKRGAENNGKHKPVWRVQITSFEHALKFLEVVGDVTGKQEQCDLIREEAARLGKVAYSDDFFYDRVVSVEPDGEDDYYTVSVPEAGNYMSQGFMNLNSGKDFVTSVGFARIAYLLLCLKDPAKYYGKPPGDSIAMLNVAINAKQAKNVFFRYFKQRVKLCPWFDGRWESTQDSITFDKNVEAHSGHSEREAWEGYNFIIVVLDEISGFATEAEATGDGGSRDKTADAIYRMYKASVSSRFPKYGKLLLLSFPRYKGDYIQTRYDAAVAEKHVVQREHKFKIHEDMPDNTPDNEFTITWDEDQIISYTEDGVFALKRPTWEVNPIIDINDLKSDFMRDRLDALSRFACMPPDAIDAFFKDREKIEQAFPKIQPGPFRDDWSWRSDFKPDKNRNYYIHVDLAYKHDRAAVAMASVDNWVTVKYGEGVNHHAPVVRVDAIRYWTPTSTQNVDLEEVKNFVVDLKRSGFPIKLVTFDRWNSVGYRQQLKADFRIDTDLLSVAKPHYEDFALALQEARVKGYNLPLLVDELIGLRIIKGNKVDHPRKGCFAGETRIPLLDGTRPMIKELDGKKAWVYSSTPDGRIVPGRARGFRTKEVTEMLDVELDNGYVARCTPEHRWMLRNGKYKEARELRPGVDRLMPINFYWPNNGGYEAVSGIHPEQSAKESTHRIVASYLSGRDIKDSEVVHHLDHIKTNNHPENLQIVKRSEHSEHHTRERHELDPEWKNRLSDATTEFNRLGSTRLKRSRYMISLGREEYVNRARKRNSFRSDVTIDSLIAIKNDDEATNANMASKILGCGRNVVVRVLGEHGYSSWEEFLTEEGVNHRVRSITPVTLESSEWVYDLEVEEWSNFALTGGVFVHNSKDVSDAVVGAVFNAIENEHQDATPEIEIFVGQPTEKPNKIEPEPEPKAKGPMPQELEEYLSRMQLI